MTDDRAGPQRIVDSVPTSDALRHGTDFARSGDKVPFPDPAMAPLGTDDEAAGRPPSRKERALAAETQMPSKAAAEAARKKPDHEGERWAGPVVIGVALICAIAIVGAYWFMR